MEEAQAPTAPDAAAEGDVFLLAPLDDAGAISRSYVLLVESETDTRRLLTELLGAECRTLELEGEEEAILFLRGGVVPCLLLVQLKISAAEAWVLADVIREYRSFGTTTVRELPETLSELLELCAVASKTN